MMISMFHSNPADRLYQNGEANNNSFFGFDVAHKRSRYFKRGWRSHGLITLKACEDTLMLLGNGI